MRHPQIKTRVRANGTVTYYVDVDGRQHGLGTDPEAAKKRFGELLARQLPRDGSTPNPTVATLVDRFLEWCADNRAPSTHKLYGEILGSFVSFIGERRRVADLRAIDVDEWLKDRYRGKSSNYRNQAVRTAKRALNWASTRDLIDRSPIAKVELPPQEHRELVISDTQWEALLKLLENKWGHSYDDFRDFLTVIWETGCRPQEARLVEAQYFDRVNRRWVFPREKSKGKKRRRVVYLTDEAYAITERLALKYPDGPIFRQENGAEWNKNAIRCKFRRLKKKLGIPDLCAYTLRHSWATLQLELGKPAIVVATLMGHTSTKMLELRYGHLDQNPAFLLSELKRERATA